MNGKAGKATGEDLTLTQALRLRQGQWGESPGLWSYPLLCLAWRLGWGGHRLVTGNELASSSAMLQTLVQGIEGPAVGTRDARADREAAAATIASHAVATDDADAPEGMPATVDRLMALLDRSPLAELVTAPDRSATVLRDTARLIRPESPRRARRRGAALLAPRPGDLARRPRAPMGAAPAAAMGSATWTLVGVLEAAWEATGTTFLGRERPALFRSRGRVAWLRATGGRSAGRWRAAAPRTVSGGTGSSRRNRRASTGFGPGRWRAGWPSRSATRSSRTASPGPRCAPGARRPDLEALPRDVARASLLARERLGGRPPAAHRGRTGRPNSERAWRGPWS